MNHALMHVYALEAAEHVAALKEEKATVHASIIAVAVDLRAWNVVLAVLMGASVFQVTCATAAETATSCVT